MPNQSLYSKAKIYAIKSPNTNKIYIGSTCHDLESRLKEHKYAFNCYNNGKNKYTSSFQIISRGDPYIELLKECPSIYKHQILYEEGEFIRLYKNNCINKRRENVSYQEKLEYAQEYYKLYNQKYFDKISVQKKNYYQENKERIKIRSKLYYSNKKNNI